MKSEDETVAEKLADIIRNHLIDYLMSMTKVIKPKIFI
jgi:hypothetical protein